MGGAWPGCSSDDVLTCGLVVVATGRAGQLPIWLEAQGFPAPAEEELAVDIRYASRHFTIPDGYLGGDKLILVGAEPGRPRGMGLFAQEDGTWLLTLVGYGPEHRLPTNDADYLGFLASVSLPDVLAAVVAGAPLDRGGDSRLPCQQKASIRATGEVPARTGCARGRDLLVQPGLRPGDVGRSTRGRRTPAVTRRGNRPPVPALLQGGRQDRRHRVGSGQSEATSHPGGQR